MKWLPRFFNLNMETDKGALQALFAIRMFGIDVAVLFAGCILDWGIGAELSICQPKYFLRTVLLFTHITIGRNNELFS